MILDLSYPLTPSDTLQKKFELALGYRFTDPVLLATAILLTKSDNRDRYCLFLSFVLTLCSLSYLGDAIIEFFMVGHLFTLLPERGEGEWM